MHSAVQKAEKAIFLWLIFDLSFSLSKKKTETRMAAWIRYRMLITSHAGICQKKTHCLASTNDLRPFICGFVWTQKEKGNPEIDLTSDLLSAD
jgi:hypothetical protein